MAYGWTFKILNDSLRISNSTQQLYISCVTQTINCINHHHVKIAATNWEDIGYCLGLEDKNMDSIETSYKVLTQFW